MFCKLRIDVTVNTLWSWKYYSIHEYFVNVCWKYFRIAVLRNTTCFSETELTPDMPQVVMQAVTPLRLDVMRCCFGFLGEMTSLKIRDILLQ